MPAKTHGLSRKIPEYRAWVNMKSRCYNPDTPGWDRYGGRGIAVCDHWFSSFENFLTDVGQRPTSKHSLDRWPDPDGDYEPNNCRWATTAEQNRNLSSNHTVTVNGADMPLVDAVMGSGLRYNTVLYRLRRGWSIERALSQKSQEKRKP